MTKYVFQDKRLHLLTRLSVIFVIAPYMMYVGVKRRDNIMLAMGVALLLFDVWSVSAGSTTSNVHHYARVGALLVQAPYMLVRQRSHTGHTWCCDGRCGRIHGVVGVVNNNSVFNRRRHRRPRLLRTRLRKRAIQTQCRRTALSW